jgi:hypothetical protein
MNTSKLLATSAVVMLMAATVPSMAQQHEGAPQRERQAPAEKMAPQQNAPKAQETPQNRGRSETTGQAPREERQGQPSGQRSQQERGRTEQQNRGRGETTGQAPREERQGNPSEQKSQQERGRTDRDRLQRDERANSPSQERDRSRSEGGRETTGQGAAGARTQNLTTEKRTRIHELVVHERNAPRVSPDFEVSVGARVPNTVRFVSLPQTIVEIEPEWRGYSYFMVGDRIVIFNPRTMEIVAIIDA